MSFSNAVVTIVSNQMLAGFGGDMYISVMTIASSMRQLLEAPNLAICEGTSPLISYNFGSENGTRVWRSIRTMSLLAVAYTACAWAFIEWKPEWFIGVFTSDEELIEQCVPLFHIYLYAFVFQALQYSGQTTFKALNKKGCAIFFSLFRKILILVPLAIFLPYVHGLGAKGVFMAEPISNFVGGLICFITMLVVVLPELRRMKKRSFA